MAKLRSSAISPSVVVGAVNEGRPHPLAPLARYVGVAVMFVGLAGLVPLAWGQQWRDTSCTSLCPTPVPPCV